MKIAYITNASYVGGWAHSVQIVNMCKAFSENGADITLVLPYRKIYAGIDLFDHYRIPRSFSVKMVPCIDLYTGSSNQFFYWIKFLSFYISARFFVWFNHFDYVYSRDFYSTLFFPNVTIEQHSFPKKNNFLFKLVLNKKRKVVALTSFLKDKFIAYGVLEKNIVVAPSAVSLYDASSGDYKFNIEGVEKGDFIFGYIGTLKTMNMEKGVSDCLSALSLLAHHYKLLVVGGEMGDIEYYKSIAKDLNVFDRVIFIGKVPHLEVPKYTSQCDIFVAPYPENEHYSYFMSPLKIFEYMASRRPIISTALPSIKEVLVHEYNALLVPPSNPKALAEAIERLASDQSLRERLSEQAYKDVVELYTWNRRASIILKKITS